MPHAAYHMPLECIDLVFKALKVATPNEACCRCYYCNAHLQQNQNPLPLLSSQKNAENNDGGTKSVAVRAREKGDIFLVTLSSLNFFTLFI